MEYEIKMFKNGNEIEIDELPDDYVRGIAEAFKSELMSRERYERMARGFFKEES